MVTTYNDGHRASLSDFPHNLPDMLHGPFCAVVVHGNIAVVNNIQHAAWVDLCVLVHSPQGTSEDTHIRCCLSARVPPSGTHVQWCTHNGDVHFAGFQIFLRQSQRESTERGRTAAAIVAAKINRAGLTLWIHGAWALNAPGVKFR